MREVTYSKRVKRIYQLTTTEFKEGKWCSDKKIIPDSEMLEVEFKMSNGILIVRDAEIKKTREEGKKNGR